MEWESSDESSADEMPLKRKRGEIVPIEVRYQIIGALETMFNTVRVNDLFSSLQNRSHAYRQEATCFEDLRDAVQAAWTAYPPELLTRVEALRMVVYREILKNGGGNQYDMPHTGINKRQASGEAVVDYSVSAALEEMGRNALAQLNDAN